MILREQVLRRRILICTWVVIAGLIASGATALPLLTELDAMARWLHADSVVPAQASALARRVLTVRDALHDTYTKYPFIGYGTDWLAFAHFVIAIAFFGALRHPMRNIWLFTFGMIASVLIVPWALIAGEVREIPLGWRFIDCSFSVGGFVPCWLAHRWTRELEQLRAANSRID